MKKLLRRKSEEPLFHRMKCVRIDGCHKDVVLDPDKVWGDCTKLRGFNVTVKGDCTQKYGSVSGLVGDWSRLRGDVSNVFGDCDGIVGSLDDCEITELTNIKDLVR